VGVRNGGLGSEGGRCCGAYHVGLILKRAIHAPVVLLAWKEIVNLQSAAVRAEVNPLFGLYKPPNSSCYSFLWGNIYPLIEAASSFRGFSSKTEVLPNRLLKRWSLFVVAGLGGSDLNFQRPSSVKR
jgi:hypothetical protein